MSQMQDYLSEKTTAILTFMNTAAEVDHKKKFIKLILESVWFGGKVEGIQETFKLLRE